LVLGYRSERKIKELAARSEGRLRIVDERQAYCRLDVEELEPQRLYEVVKEMLRV
jgi:hypothetical protein